MSVWTIHMNVNMSAIIHTGVIAAPVMKDTAWMELHLVKVSIANETNSIQLFALEDINNCK